MVELIKIRVKSYACVYMVMYIIMCSMLICSLLTRITIVLILLMMCHVNSMCGKCRTCIYK